MCQCLWPAQTAEPAWCWLGTSAGVEETGWQHSSEIICCLSFWLLGRFLGIYTHWFSSVDCSESMLTSKQMFVCRVQDSEVMLPFRLDLKEAGTMSLLTRGRLSMIHSQEHLCTCLYASWGPTGSEKIYAHSESWSAFLTDIPVQQRA